MVSGSDVELIDINCY